MTKTSSTPYLLRKSKQTEESIPLLGRNDFPLRFYFKGREVNISVTTKGNLAITYMKANIQHVYQDEVPD